MNLWLDDVRKPWLHDDSRVWVWAKTAQEAIDYLKTGEVTYASLDHDLWLCPECQKKSKEEIVVIKNGPEYGSICSCNHNGTGLDVVCWMEANNVWPHEGVRVHSMNPEGRRRMEAIIARAYRKEQP
jgi:hypothetical protein